MVFHAYVDVKIICAPALRNIKWLAVTVSGLSSIALADHSGVCEISTPKTSSRVVPYTRSALIEISTSESHLPSHRPEQQVLHGKGSLGVLGSCCSIHDDQSQVYIGPRLRDLENWWLRVLKS